MKIIIICLIAYLVYDYIRDRRIEKKLAKEKAEILKGGDQNAQLTNR